ncbi:hypothetical protein P692DRAFT_201800010 [Suillus brevipes Sb2]|nr:hypothetical protein P692DRAFT_201800010 [Suillus brevipes Sb2]
MSMIDPNAGRLAINALLGPIDGQIAASAGKQVQDSSMPEGASTMPANGTEFSEPAGFQPHVPTPTGAKIRDRQPCPTPTDSSAYPVANGIPAVANGSPAGVDGYMMRDGRLCIYELMAEESAVNYWEKYGHVAFDSSQKAVLTSCVLPANAEKGDVPNEEGFINRCFSFTIRRDKWGIPSMIVGNFIKC